MGSGRGAAVPLPDLAVADAEGQEGGAQAQGGQGEEGDAVGEGAAGAGRCGQCCRQRSRQGHSQGAGGLPLHVERAVRLARRVQAGQIAVNTLGDGGPAGAIGAPFGGYRHSGFGRSMGPDYLEDWTQVKCLVINAG